MRSIRMKLSVSLFIVILLLLFSMIPSSIINAQKAKPDNEREVPSYCSPERQKVQIICCEGSIDCQPRNCN